MSRDKLETFYLAGDYARRDELETFASVIEREFDMSTTARWLRDQPKFKDNGLGGELEGEDAANAAVVAKEDLQDVFAAELFVQFTTGEKARGGRHVELGFALAAKESWPSRQVIVVGPREHAFHYAPGVHHCRDLDEFWVFLRGFMAGYEVP